MPRFQPKANVQSGPQGREYDAIADRIAADRPGRILDVDEPIGTHAD